MSAAHTPGPWTAEGRRIGYMVFTEAVRSADGGGRHTVAMMMDGTTDQCAANAHLIAAAPELLEALAEFVRIGDLPIKHEIWKAADAKARAALAKARGAA